MEYFLFVKIWLAYLLFLLYYIWFLSMMIVSWHESRWCCKWIFRWSSRL